MGAYKLKNLVLNHARPKSQTVSRSPSKEALFKDDYSGFKEINGQHPFQDQVPGSYVLYKARRREGGKVVYFNFSLAKEMGLIEHNHPHKLTRSLEKVLLQTFGLMIINEYDLINKTKAVKSATLPHHYMATRYLQLQHPNKKGKTSGDGRSIWNGVFHKNGKTWDLSSCGTGATCLSPATAIFKKFFKTGDPQVSYGCGYSDLLDGLGASVLSDIFHRNNIKTERTLLVIEYPQNLSINVRAGLNLLRPSHFFLHLKQNHWERLKAVTDYYLDRQIKNGEIEEKVRSLSTNQRYDHLLKYFCRTFAQISAQFEREYIFCWLDWDGDNILADGGIIDYGSVRQFGLFHYEYRYDDVERMSTNIIEQKLKSRYIVQTFIQMVDYLKTKEKKNIKTFQKHPLLEEFDRIYLKEKNKLLLYKLGLHPKYVNFLCDHHEEAISEFEKSFSYFEKAKSNEGPIEVGDGVTVNAIYCMRDLLRELPPLYLKDFNPIPGKLFLEILKSQFADEDALFITPYRQKKIEDFQETYQKLIMIVASQFGISMRNILIEMSMRSSIINRYERVTGDAVIHLARKLMKERKKIPSEKLHLIFEEFVSHQVLVPEKKINFNVHETEKRLKTSERDIIKQLNNIVKHYREGI